MLASSLRVGPTLSAETKKTSREKQEAFYSFIKVRTNLLYVKVPPGVKALNKLVKPYQCFQSQRHGTSRRVKTPAGQREATAGRTAFNQQRSAFPLVTFRISEHLIMIKICVTLNEGQDQHN